MDWGGRGQDADHHRVDHRCGEDERGVSRGPHTGLSHADENRYGRVDMSTLARRLDELDIASPQKLALVRATRTRRSDIVEIGLLVADELSPAVSDPDLECRQRQEIRLERT